MIPTLGQAKRLLEEAAGCNPGPWREHSITAAHCARKIAERCGDMDGNKAGILALLHDIGRKFGTRHLGHVSDGYSYMMSLGYDEVAQICLTHSFHSCTLEEYVGKIDTTAEEKRIIETQLKRVKLSDYDRLVQLCDALAGSQGVVYMEERMLDVKNRYGSYPQSMWNANISLKAYFEKKAQGDLYEIVEKETYRPDK